MPRYEWWYYIVFALPGIFFYVMNWGALIANMRSDRFISCTPPLGGFWIAVVCLLSPWKFTAFIGLTDPGFWLLAYSLIEEFVPGGRGKRKKDGQKEDGQMENDPTEKDQERDIT